MIFLNLKVSFPTSRLCPVTVIILSQCRSIMALLAMCSSSGQHSLKSSMVFFRSRKACQSFRARGSFRHLRRKASVKGQLKMSLDVSSPRLSASISIKTVTQNSHHIFKSHDSEDNCRIYITENHSSQSGQYFQFLHKN